MIYVISLVKNADSHRWTTHEVRTVAARSAVEALQGEGYNAAQINPRYNSAFVNLTDSTQLWAEKI